LIKVGGSRLVCLLRPSPATTQHQQLEFISGVTPRSVRLSRVHREYLRRFHTYALGITEIKKPNVLHCHGDSDKNYGLKMKRMRVGTS
jgi:hypothetical protein